MDKQMDDKERVLTLASASRMTGVEQNKLQSMIDEGRLEAVKIGRAHV